MNFNGKLLIGKSDNQNILLLPQMANRHGLIAGATGTGKTVTVKVLAESFSSIGVPVFLADIKGDLSAMGVPGQPSPSVQERIQKLGLDADGFSMRAFPANFWDIYGENGLPLRTTVSEMGPLLLAQILDLNDTQSDILSILFQIADDESLLLIDTKDLRAMVQYVGENAKEYSLRYGNIAKQSLGAITRSIIALESQGADLFFGEPALDIRDWLCTDASGLGMIQMLDCRKLILNPAMYAAFMLWLLSELFETLPEAGDLDKPRMVFFFDEAHLLFDRAPKALADKVEQVVKLIRSKGVGIYFITQNPADIPNGVLSQLGNKIQHALRAYTPAEQRRARAAAQSLRENPDFDTFTVLQNLGIGQALVSVLDEQGVPTVARQCTILPPQSQMGMLSDALRAKQIQSSLLFVRYGESVDRDSAYEFLNRLSLQVQQQQQDALAEKERARQAAETEKQRQKEAEAEKKAAQKAAAAQEKQRQKEAEAERKAAEKKAAARQRAVKSAASSVAGTAAGTIGRELGNQLGGALGGSFGKRLGGNVGASLGRGILSTLFKLRG